MSEAQMPMGQVKRSAFPLPQVFKTILMAHRWLKKARQEISKSFEERRKTALSGVIVEAEPDPALLAKLVVRQKTCRDLCQGFSKEHLALALCRSGNHAPTALLLLAACRHYMKVHSPPRYFLDERGRVQQQPMAVWAKTRKTKLRLIWSSVDTVFGRTHAEARSSRGGRFNAGSFYAEEDHSCKSKEFHPSARQSVQAPDIDLGQLDVSSF
eukprot:Skav210770  [mRNA]  locus=scaffold3765:35989:36624:+ [translate_table: standard]